MNCELEVIALLQKQIKGKTVTRPIRFKRLFDLNNVSIEEFIDHKTGKVIKKYCMLYEGENSSYKVNKPYNELKLIKDNKPNTVIGFISKSKKYGIK